MEQGTLTVEWVGIDRLHLNPANPRLNEEAIPHVAASIRRFGFQQPVVAKHSGEVIAGNTRLKAAVSLGLAQVPVVWFEGSDLDATAYGIADNRTHEFSSFDEASLAKLLQELRAEDALEGVGFTGEDIDALLKELGQECENQVDDPGPTEPPAKPDTRTRDQWLHGDHRLLCGDSSKPDDFERLMAGERARLLSSDPAYAVN
jgi:hypothetical protein